MATIFRALTTAVLLLFAYVVVTGLAMDGTARLAPGALPAAVSPEDAALAWHLRVGLVTVIVAALVQSLPFAYFLGTGFWIQAFARASRAGPSWGERHKQWLKCRAYPVLYLAPLATAGTAITGSLVETSRIAPPWHVGFLVSAIVLAAAELFVVPREMKRNSALMDELADSHQVPLPDSPEAEALIEEESRAALPPLFQLSRILMYAGAQLFIIWLYLRFGTEGWRDTPMWPFGLAFVVLLTAGLGLNARHDPNRPRPPVVAWTRAALVGGACAVALAFFV
jgi:hypothetical protein